MFLFIDTLSESSSVDDSSIESEIYSSSATLRSFVTKLPSSKFAKVIILPVYSWYDVAYGIYKTDGCVASASVYRRDVYPNALEKVCQIQRCVKNYYLCTRYVDEAPFLMFWNSNEDTKKTLLWTMTHI